MKTLALIALGTALAVSLSSAQNLPEPEQLQEAQEDVSYAELLNAADLSSEQLEALNEIQVRLQAESLVPPDLAAALTKLLAAVLSGMSVQEAQAALGPQQQALGEAQQRWQQTMQQGRDELLKLLTQEQKDALVWFGSPAHALDGVVDAVSQMRALPDEQWNQVKPQLMQGLSQLTGAISPGAGITPEEIGELLDQARALDDATFEAQRGTLAQTWLPTLMPNIAQMLQTPQFQQQQLTQVCERLLTYERRHLLVAAKLDASAAQ